MEGRVIGMWLARVGFAAGLIVSGSALGQAYNAMPLGSLGGTQGSSAIGINDTGDVVGWSDTNAGEYHAYYWHAGVMIDIGTLQGGTESRALSISNNGVIVGTSKDSTGNDRAVKWVKNALGQWEITDLGTLSGGAFAVANRISDNGKIVGVSGRGSGPAHAFLYVNGAMQDLGILNYPANLGHSEALGVNDGGLAVGYAYAPLWGPDHGFLYDGQTTLDITPAGQFSFARGVSINNHNLVAGILIQPGGGSSGFEAATYTQSGGWVELGVLHDMTESEASDVNENGEVVGRSYDLATQAYRGFIYLNGGMLDVNNVAVVPVLLTEALDINNIGAFTANADTPGGVVAYVLTPDRGCYANCDRSTNPPVLNVNDFLCFGNLFAAGDPAANCDGSTAEPVLNVSDFVCFLNAFAAGCP